MKIRPFLRGESGSGEKQNFGSSPPALNANCFFDVDEGEADEAQHQVRPPHEQPGRMEAIQNVSLVLT